MTTELPSRRCLPLRESSTVAAHDAPGLIEDQPDLIEEQLDQHPPDQPTIRLSLTDDVSRRSFTWARWQLGHPLPVE